MARRKSKTEPVGLKVSEKLGEDLTVSKVQEEKVLEPVSVSAMAHVNHGRTGTENTATTKPSVGYDDLPETKPLDLSDLGSTNQAKVKVGETVEPVKTDDPDYALYYYSKGPRNVSVASAWFGVVFTMLAWAGFLALFLTNAAMVDSDIKIELPYDVLGLVWFAGLVWLPLVSLGCGVYGLFTAKSKGFSFQPAIWGIALSVITAVGYFAALSFVWG